LLIDVQSMNVTSVVLDASASIALLRREPGMDVVRKHLANAVISAVNYSEVLKKTIERGGAYEPVDAYVRSASLEIVPFDTEQALSSAELYPLTRPHGMSFADRACLNLGIRFAVHSRVLRLRQRSADSAAVP
jgi:PIN domain nuclease of toxin-antitoxin system